ncbi:carbon monoxide dehydrogenase [Streptomyces sp. NPDC000594]|uniref:carbon monoxide dehydrogenase n=1 Tax=Streptomyces sp. NPDC000594 TaxID=3154261 RepID=UPI00331F0F6C
MDHEVFVPAPADAVRQVLSDPARFARCVQGLHADAPEADGEETDGTETDGTEAGAAASAEAGAEAGAARAGDPLAGRLRIRAGGHTITYRGALRLETAADGVTVRGEGTEVRGEGTVRLELTIRPAPAEGGTVLSIGGTATATGRLAELAAGVREQTAHRLLDGFGERLAEVAADHPGTGTTPEHPGAPDYPVPADHPVTDEGDDEGDGDGEDGKGAGGEHPVSEEAVPGSPLDLSRAQDLQDLSELSAVSDLAALGGLSEPDGVPDEVPPAEAAHARRTMIGRSAEEVDHAPPRGRYAPVPAPGGDGRGLALRWIAPAAALAVASAVVIHRALRRRA